MSGEAFALTSGRGRELHTALMKSLLFPQRPGALQGPKCPRAVATSSSTASRPGPVLRGPKLSFCLRGRRRHAGLLPSAGRRLCAALRRVGGQIGAKPSHRRVSTSFASDGISRVILSPSLWLRLAQSCERVLRVNENRQAPRAFPVPESAGISGMCAVATANTPSAQSVSVRAPAASCQQPETEQELLFVHTVADLSFGAFDALLTVVMLPWERSGGL